jgi:RNA polymerase sigma factor (sigma-70 family)
MLEEQELLDLLDKAQLRYLPKPTHQDLRDSNRAILKLWHEFEAGLKRRFLSRFNGLDPQDFLESVMDGFNKAVKTFNRGLGSFQSWLELKVKNVLLSHCQRQKNYKHQFQNSSMPLESLHDEQIPSYEQDFESHYLLREVFESLPSTTQEIFSLYCEGYTWQEIGAHLGWNKDTARITFSRQIQKLKNQYLKPEGTRSNVVIPISRSENYRLKVS